MILITTRTYSKHVSILDYSSLIVSPSSGNKLYWIFVVDSLSTNLALISERHKIQHLKTHFSAGPSCHCFSYTYILQLFGNIGWVYISWWHVLSISKYSFVIFKPIVDIVKSDASNRIFENILRQEKCFQNDFFMARFFHKGSFWIYFGKIWHISWIFANTFGRGFVLWENSRVVQRLSIFVACRQ